MSIMQKLNRMMVVPSKLLYLSRELNCQKVYNVPYLKYSISSTRTISSERSTWWTIQSKAALCVRQNHWLKLSDGNKVFLNQMCGVRYSEYCTKSGVCCVNKKFYSKLPKNTTCNENYFKQCSSSYCTNQSIQKEQGKQNDKTKADIEELLEKENIFTVPNLLTMSRIVLTPFLGYLVLQESFPIASAVFFIAGITDLLDGYIARNFKNQLSAFGSFLDPLADKFLVSVLYVTLSIVHLIPVPLAVLVLSRDALLIGAAFYVRFISLPPPKTLSRYFNATKVSAELKPLFISKVNTSLQLLVVAASLTAPVFDFVNHPALQCLWYATAATTVASGVGYMFAKGTFMERRKKVVE